jgi:hypothetical protein
MGPVPGLELAKAFGSAERGELGGGWGGWGGGLQN